MGRRKKEEKPIEVIHVKMDDFDEEDVPNKEPNIKYFSVVYLDNKTVHLEQADTKAEAERTIEWAKKESKMKGHIKATRVIKRDLSNYKDGLFI